MIVTADSVTELADVAGRVLVAGSHGGIVAAHYAARARVRAVILNDAGIGKDQAGISGLRWADGRFARHRARHVWGLDSIGLVLQQDAGRLLLIGSHAALHGGRRESALSVDVAFAAFNDAGGASSRLPVLDERDIPAATVGCMSARIGDARSMWETGVLTQANRAAACCNVVAGQPVRAAIDRIIAAQKKG